jgi:hypothetical protein
MTSNVAVVIVYLLGHVVGDELTMVILDLAASALRASRLRVGGLA